jgi:hypothetical protein
MIKAQNASSENLRVKKFTWEAEEIDERIIVKWTGKYKVRLMRLGITLHKGNNDGYYFTIVIPKFQHAVDKYTLSL